MAIKRLVIHLGIGKAGSTSIQRALFTNSAILEKNGFRYLTEWGEKHVGILHSFFTPFPIDIMDKVWRGIQTEEERQNLVKSKTDVMLEVINATTCETMIISGEFWRQLWIDSTNINISEFLRKYFQDKGIEVTIIFLVRNPLTFMISLYQQALSSGSHRRFTGPFEEGMRSLNGIINLKKYFADSLLLLKFEDAVADKDGLVGCFLKAIGFPYEKIQDLNVEKMNEAACMEAMELIKYIEDKEPLLLSKDGPINPNRRIHELLPLKNVKGVKFDLSYRDKKELWERLRETVQSFKENLGIDYTDYKVPTPSGQKTYRKETIQGFVEVFPKLSPVLQKLFLQFFEKKYTETAQEKFKMLLRE